MQQTSFEENIFQVYEQLFKYKDLLQGAPVMTIDPASVTNETFAVAFPNIHQQTRLIMGYLMGLKDRDLEPQKMVKSVEKNYQKDDFWRRLIVKYIEAVQAEDESNYNIRKTNILNDANTVLEKMRAYKAARKKLIEAYSAELDKEGFLIDSKKLFRNYMNMAQRNQDKAWELVTVNPAAFSPILVFDKDGNRLLTAKEAHAHNEKIGRFIKKIKL